MASVTLTRSALNDARMACLMEYLNAPRALACGLLALFWLQTREAGVEAGTHAELAAYLPLVPGHPPEAVLHGLAYAGYLSDGAVVDNAGYNAKAQKRAERAKQAGQASAAKRAKAKRKPKAAAPKPAPVVAPAAASIAPAANALAWAAYAEAYQGRHGSVPLRNAKVNSLVANFVKRVGAEDAPAVLRFYVAHGNYNYVQRMHPLDFALRDAEGLYAQMRAGRVMTVAQARAAERGDNERTVAVKSQLDSIDRGEI